MNRIQKRNKYELARDVTKVLKSDLHLETKKVVIDNALWNWSGYEGKIKGCKLWSRNAWKEKNNSGNLRHEHVVPKKVLIQKLFVLQDVDEKKVYEILAKFCIGVVITTCEDKVLNKIGLRSAMPVGWDNEDPWARYRQAELYHYIFEPNQSLEVTQLAGARSAPQL